MPTLIGGAVSSNRIEGVNVDQKRVKSLIFGESSYKDRNEEEVAGYRKALTLIHSQGAELALSESNLLKFHKLSRGDIWDGNISVIRGIKF